MSWTNPQTGRRFPAALLILCGGLLAGTAQAAPYTPDTNATVLATLSESQRALTPASPPQNETDALRLARAQIDYGRQQGDPRFLGYAQRTLAPFSQPPSPAVNLLWADIEQQRHQFTQARIRLTALLEQHPNQGQGWLMLANIERVQGQFDAARQACRQAANSLPPTTVVLCQASVQAMTGQHQHAYATLQSLADSLLVGDTTQVVWLQTLIAEMAIQQGEPERAQQALDTALALAPQDAYLRYLQSDLWLQEGKPHAVIEDLKNWQDRDNALLRLAIAGQRSQHPHASQWQQAYQQRLQAAEQAGRSVHQREQARYLLQVAPSPDEALTVARKNWEQQKELADLRLLLAAATAADSTDARATVRDFIDSHGVHDAALQAHSPEAQP